MAPVPTRITGCLTAARFPPLNPAGIVHEHQSSGFGILSSAPLRRELA